MEETKEDVVESEKVTDIPIEETREDIVETLPPLLRLKDEEKFKDCDGNIIEIETRGEKSRNDIYFKVKDIMAAFDMPKLNDIIIDKRYDGYERGIDYKTFKREIRPGNHGSKTPNKKFKTTLYLTYHGLLRVLFVSRNKQVKHFQDWAEEKLFTIQMGSKEEKTKLGADMLGVSIKTLKDVFETTASTFPSIYLFELATVKDLREQFVIDESIPDDSFVYKYGCSKDLGKRSSELGTQYNKIPNVNMKLSIFHTVDVIHKYEAENEIRDLCKSHGKHLKVAGFNELVVLNKIEYARIRTLLLIKVFIRLNF